MLLLSGSFFEIDQVSVQLFLITLNFQKANMKLIIFTQFFEDLYLQELKEKKHIFHSIRLSIFPTIVLYGHRPLFYVFDLRLALHKK